jgi:ADP-heptose:LPS heptosyltransferase
MKKFCIVQLGRIGDLILTTPLIKALKDTFPDSEVHILAGRNNYQFIKDYPLVDQVYVYQKKIIDTFLLFRKLKKEKYDYWIDPKDHYSGESLFFKRLAKPLNSSGFNRKTKQDYTYSVKSAEEQYDMHVIDRYLDAVSFLKIKATVKRPVLFLSDQSESELLKYLNNHKIKKYIHINISASKAERYWPRKKWIELIKKIGSDSTLIISADPKDKDFAIVLSESGENCFYYQTKSLSDLYSLSNHSEVLISPDTSVIHIASAFNKKIIGLYANRPWNLIKYAPSSDHSKVLINENSYSKIDEITVTDVYAAYREMINL